MSSLEKVDRNLSILVVDEQPTMRSVTRNVLKRLGFTNVDEAEDHAIALEKIRAGSFGCIICDWAFPVGSRSDFIKKMRSDSSNKIIPVLIVAPDAQKQKVKESIKEENVGIIVKPFTADILKKKLEETLSADVGNVQ